jgi:hypothetical protein
LRYIAHRPPKVSSGNVYCCGVILQPIFWLCTAIMCSRATRKLKEVRCRLTHDPGSKAHRTRSSLPLHQLCLVDSVQLEVRIIRGQGPRS